MRLKDRVDRGLTDKKVLLVGDELERNNVYAQMEHSGLFNKRNITNSNRHDNHAFTEYDLVILCFSEEHLKSINDGKKHILDDEQTNRLKEVLAAIGNSDATKEALGSKQDIVGLITLCPPGSLDTEEQKDPFKRPFTVVVNQIGRMITDIFSLLTTLPPRNRN